jgi:magnesium transporter
MFDKLKQLHQLKKLKDTLEKEKIEKDENINRPLEYKEDTAGRIMNPNFFSLPLETNVAETIKKLRKTDTYEIPYIYIVDNNGCLIGVLSLRDLIVAKPNTKLNEIVNRKIVYVTTDVDQEKVASLVKRYNLRAIPVVDKTNKLVGIVTVDDILDILTKEATEDIYHMAGIKENGLLHRPIFDATRLRLPWLIICLVGGLLAASIIGMFEKTLAEIIVLAAFIPVIMDMGGNIGTQSSTIIVRGLAIGSINIKNIWSILWRELCIGLLIGIICGVAVGVIAQIWKGAPNLGIAVGISMVTTVTIAAFLGAFLPILFQRVGQDPAIASGPVITTIKDITGLLIYFGAATLIML